MPYRFLEDTAIADVAFEASGKTIEELFESAAEALTATMVKDPEALKHKVGKNLVVAAESLEMLLFQFLQEIIFYKDAEQLLFNRFDLRIGRMGGLWQLSCDVSGDTINPSTHELVADVKAVSFHQFRIEETSEGWTAYVILDV